uniref:Ring finger protein 17 n=1 Tax=Acanthochromis polyacanthus TaxID=80966 RepID=A0A3Q1GIU1_9TELE
MQVESTLPKEGVDGLQEDSRIIGLIYTAKMNKIKSLRCERSKSRRKNKLSTSPDVKADTENMEQTLTSRHEKQVMREKARLEMEIKQTTDKALHAEVQFSQLTELESQYSTSKAVMCHVQERIKALETAMQMAREVRRSPFLEKYCTLDKVLETLQAPVDKQLFDMKCVTVGSGMSLSESSPVGYQLDSSNGKSPCKGAEGNNSTYMSTSPNKLCTPQKQGRKSPGTNSPPSRGSSTSPRPCRRSNLSGHSSASDLSSPDVIIEELLDEEQGQGLCSFIIYPLLTLLFLKYSLPPTGPQLASDKWRKQKRKKNLFPRYKRSVSQWVVVTHIVNPSHFYVRYVAEKREIENLSKKIHHFCGIDSCRFTSRDMVEIGSVIFVKWKDLWCRASVVEVLQNGCTEAVRTCPVTQLKGIRVFLLDSGFTISITIPREEEATETSLKAVDNHLRKVDEAVKLELGCFAPQAIRCSLKDLVPYDLTRGWSKEAQAEFRNVVGSAAVVMRALGQDRDSLLVDLKKAAMDQSSDVPISIRQYLVFIEVARFYSPVTLGRSPLLYYPPVYPKINTELNAVVSHINSPGDFYMQLVDNMESLLLSAKLQECYDETTVVEQGKLNIYCPVIGQACVARFDDKSWYRAQVIGHPGERKVEVQYVDFGNKSILSVNDLRKIKDEFFALPAMAIHCCLSDVIPVEGEVWSEACTSRFISLAHQKLVTIMATEYVTKSAPLPVKLFEGDLNGPQTNIAELLIKEELACFKEGLKSKNDSPSCDDSAIWDPPLELGSTMDEASAPQQIIPGEENDEPFQPQLKFPAQLKDLKVKVSHVNSPSSFYVQFAHSDFKLKRICELLKQECALMEPQDVVWKADMYCAALISGVWERGQILSDVTSSNTAEVRRCDYGNVVKVHVSDLRPLPSSSVGSLAVECTLSDIRPAGGRSRWTDTACDIIAYYLSGASATVTIKELTDERPLPVTLFCFNRMGKFISIADFLVSEGLALRERKPRDAAVQQPVETDSQSPLSKIKTDDEKKDTPSGPVVSLPSPSSLVSTAAPPKPAPRTIMSAEKVKTSLYRPPELPGLGHIQITVSAVDDDGVIFVRTENAECQLEQLRERIQQSMKTLPRQKPYTWKSVLGCAVIGPDMLWYRGQLLEVLGGHVKVQYVDCGLIENIPVVHVYPLLLCDDVPQLCIPCQLHGINPVGGKWQQDAVALLREMLLNRSVDMQVVELPDSPRGPITVELFLDGLNLSRIVCHHEHASKDTTVSSQKELMPPPPPPLLDDWDINTEGLRGPEEPMLGPFVDPSMPQEGEHFHVRVKHLWTPNELFLWPLEGTADMEVNGETLEEALIRINANISSLPRLTNFPRGGPCLAEYSDGKFYRARLLKFTSVEPVTILVQHVDFGSDDTLPTSKYELYTQQEFRLKPNYCPLRLTNSLQLSEWLCEAVLKHTNMTSAHAGQV